MSTENQISFTIQEFAKDFSFEISITSMLEVPFELLIESFPPKTVQAVTIAQRYLKGVLEEPYAPYIPRFHSLLLNTLETHPSFKGIQNIDSPYVFLILNVGLSEVIYTGLLRETFGKNTSSDNLIHSISPEICYAFGILTYAQKYIFVQTVSHETKIYKNNFIKTLNELQDRKASAPLKKDKLAFLYSAISKDVQFMGNTLSLLLHQSYYSKIDELENLKSFAVDVIPKILSNVSSLEKNNGRIEESKLALTSKIASEIARSNVVSGRWRLRDEHFEVKVLPEVTALINENIKHNKMAAKLVSMRNKEGNLLCSYEGSNCRVEMTQTELKGLIKKYLKDIGREDLIAGMHKKG